MAVYPKAHADARLRADSLTQGYFQTHPFPVGYSLITLWFDIVKASMFGSSKFLLNQSRNLFSLSISSLVSKSFTGRYFRAKECPIGGFFSPQLAPTNVAFEYRQKETIHKRAQNHLDLIDMLFMAVRDLESTRISLFVF
jgi:hypothetical protein